MAGDDHPNKKVVAAGESNKAKGKATVVQVESSKTTEEEKSDSLPPPTSPGLTTEVPPIKKSKVDDAASSADTAAALPPPQPEAPPSNQVPCPLCNRVFDSFPAMFGHQRVHKERQYRGAYPPPTFNRERTPSPQYEELEEAARDAAEMLLELSKGVLEKGSPVAVVTDPGEGSSRGVGIDLNIPLEAEKSTEDEEAEEEGREKVRLDLNRTPSSGSD